MADQVSPSELEFILHSLTWTRYLGAAGLVLLLYDHFLTLDQEIEEIWKARWTLPKIFFIALRYVVPSLMIIEAYQISGISNNEITTGFCRGYFVFSMVMAISSISTSNLLILLRLWALWGRDRRLIMWTFLGFVLVQMAAVATLVYFIVTGISLLVWNETLHICGITQRPHVQGLWVPGIAFECVVFTAAVVNGFHRPRSAELSLITALFRDGIHYFVILFLLRLTNFFFAILAPLPLLVTPLLFVWSGTTVTVTRFLLNIRRTASEQQRIRDSYDEGVSQFPMVTRETTSHSDSADSVKPGRW